MTIRSVAILANPLARKGTGLAIAAEAKTLLEKRGVHVEVLAGTDLADAQRLADLVAGLPCKLNLIPFNPHPGSEFRRPADERVAAFKAALQARHLNTSIRTTRGDERMAACGQLGTAPTGERPLPPRSLRPRKPGGSTPGSRGGGGAEGGGSVNRRRNRARTAAPTPAARNRMQPAMP